MRVEEVRVLSSIPQLHLSATNETHLSSVVPSVEHLCRVAHPIQVSVKHLHDVALATVVLEDDAGADALAAVPEDIWAYIQENNR